MKTIKVKPKQTIFDVALEQYGTCEAVGEILMNNPEIANDTKALATLGIEGVDNIDFHIDVALDASQTIKIDTDSELLRNATIKQIETDITTFDL